MQNVSLYMINAPSFYYLQLICHQDNFKKLCSFMEIFIASLSALCENAVSFAWVHQNVHRVLKLPPLRRKYYLSLMNDTLLPAPVHKMGIIDSSMRFSEAIILIKGWTAVRQK